MTEEISSPASEVEGLLRRLEEARVAMMEAAEAGDQEQFAVETTDGESVKRALERTADDLNFYYGRLVARAVSLPQAPYLQRADFPSPREAVASLQAAHRRFTNLLHDLVPSDLERTAFDEEHGAYTLRQVLEMTAAHYRMRAQQLRQLVAQESAGN